MRLRSLLFVPGDRPERMQKALNSGADALILDLEDAVAPDAKTAARQAVANFLAEADRSVPVFVRVNPLESVDIDFDFEAFEGHPPDALMLPKSEGASTIVACIDRLAHHSLSLPILPIANETPSAVFSVGTYGAVAEHLCGVTWGAEDLAASVGAATSRDETGRLTAPYELARSLTLFGAHAASLPAIETVFPAFRDLESLSQYAARAARDGFNGMMAIHPSQVAPINAAFTPSENAVAHARAVVSAFEGNPGAGAIQLNGRMIDAPHLKLARRILSQVGA